MAKQKLPEVFCQNCRAPNNLREPNCVKCGARLMLVVFPNSLQYDTNIVPSYYEDHLLERVTMLEVRLMQVLNRLELAYDFIERAFDSFGKERVIMESFLEAVREFSPELGEIIDRRHAEHYIQRKSERKTAKKASDGKKTYNEILRHHPHPNGEIFAKLVSDGFELLRKNEEKEAFQMLERAALLSPQNFPLHFFIAVRLYRADKYAAAAKYLEKMHSTDAANPPVRLFLAALGTDTLNFEAVGKLLKGLEKAEEFAPIVDFIKAFQAAFAADWKKSIKRFENILKLRQDAEIYYLLGCAYFQANDFAQALKHLEKAVIADDSYADAWLMQWVIYKLQNNQVLEKSSFEKSTAGQQSGSQSAKYLKNSQSAEIKTALPFAHFSEGEGKNGKLLTGGALRVTRFFRRMLLGAVEADYLLDGEKLQK